MVVDAFSVAPTEMVSSLAIIRPLPFRLSLYLVQLFLFISLVSVGLTFKQPKDVSVFVAHCR
jgi:hypothetical protein